MLLAEPKSAPHNSWDVYSAKHTSIKCLVLSMLTSTVMQVAWPCVTAAGRAEALMSMAAVGFALARKTLEAMALPNDSKLLAAAAACIYTSGATVLDGSVIVLP